MAPKEAHGLGPGFERIGDIGVRIAVEHVEIQALDRIGLTVPVGGEVIGPRFIASAMGVVLSVAIPSFRGR